MGGSKTGEYLGVMQTSQSSPCAVPREATLWESWMGWRTGGSAGFREPAWEWPYQLRFAFASAATPAPHSLSPPASPPPPTLRRWELAVVSSVMFPGLIIYLGKLFNLDYSS